MKPPLLLHIFGNFDVGGVQMRTVALINALGRRYRHHILALGGAYSAAAGLIGDAEVELLPPPALAGHLGQRLRALGTMIRAENPDLLLSYNWTTIEAGLANLLYARRRHIHHEAGFGVEEADRQLTRRIWFRRLALCRSSRVAVPSFTLLGIAQKVWHFPARKLIHIPDGIDVQRFDIPGDPSVLPGLAPGGKLIGTVAPLRPEKDIGRLLRLVANLRAHDPDIAAVIVGDGPQMPALVAEAARLGLREAVRFTGHLDAVEKVYGLLDLFILTSRTEQFPNVVLQAMAAGRAVVATDVGDIKAMVALDNAAYIVARDDDTALADAAAALLRDRERATRIGAANRQRVIDQFGLDTMAARYDAMFKEVLA